jgi:hypothetical protein
MNESVILCEGFYDRAFWAGWLEHLGCTDPGLRSDRTGRIPIRDPWNALVGNGQFAFLSRGKQFLRIVPCHGKNNVSKAAESRLKDRQDKPLVRLVLSVDSDESIDAPGSESQRYPYPALGALIQTLGQCKKNERGEFILEGDGTSVSTIRWDAKDAANLCLPSQQCLERLVCAAIVAAHPHRGPTVKNWLDSRPQAPAAGPKEFAWSHMAGWYAEFGSETFYRKIWRDERLVAELKSRLMACGAWRIAEALAE